MMDTMSAWPAQGKRREPDDFVTDLLSSFTLSPPKKRRTEVGAEPVAGIHAFGAPAAFLSTELENTVASVPARAVLPPPVAVPVVAPAAVPAVVPAPAPAANHEKALVLYKPMNPPLFPGGPPAGSSELPYRFNTSFISSKAIDVSAALDPRQHWLSRVSSGSTVPFVSSSFRDQNMQEGKEDRDEKVDNDMAVVPWVPGFSFPFAVQQMNGVSQSGIGDAELPDAELPDAELPDAELPDADVLEADSMDAMEESFDEETQFSNAAENPFGRFSHSSVGL